MKRTKITLVVLLILTHQFAIAQTGQWKLAGNSLNGTQKFGSTNNFPLNFITNNTTRMSLTSTGLFGIGTTAPEGNLHIFRGSAGAVTANANAPLIVENFSDNFINILAPTTNESGILFGNPTSSADGGIVYNNISNRGGFQFRTSSNFTRMVLTNGGSLGLGTITPKTNLHIFKGNSGISTPNSNAPLIVENSSDNFINLLTPSANESGVLFGTNSSSADGGIVYNNPAVKNGFQFRTNGNFTRMVLTKSGFLGLNTTNPASDLHILHGNNEGTNGLRIQNNGTQGSKWTFFTTDITGSLELFDKHDFVGAFDEFTGEYFNVSDVRRKKDIEKAQNVLEKIMQLDIKKYHFLENKAYDKKHYGMIAQEVEKIFPEVVRHNNTDGTDKHYYTMNYSAFGVLAIKAIQEQQQTIEEQQQKISTLEERIAKLEAAFNSNISSANNSNATSKEISGATLEQNQPNPFSQSTIIRYHLPQGSSGQINLYDANGTLAKTLKANESGQAVMNGNDLKAGTYSYTLIVNGKIAASKKMIIAK